MALALAEPVVSLTSSVDGLITVPLTMAGDNDTERLLNKKTSETVGAKYQRLYIYAPKKAIEFGNTSTIKLRHIYLLNENFQGEYNSLVKAAK